jgi:hypothetical protein
MDRANQSWLKDGRSERVDKTDKSKRKGVCFGGKVLTDKKSPPLFLDQFSFRPIIFFVFVFFSLCSSGFGQKTLWEEVGGSIRPIHCQKSTLR